jgi:phosphoketolase
MCVCRSMEFFWQIVRCTSSSPRVGLNHMYSQCIHGLFGRKINKLRSYMVHINDPGQPKLYMDVCACKHVRSARVHLVGLATTVYI